MRVPHKEQLDSDGLLEKIDRYSDCSGNIPISIKAVYTKDHSGNWVFLIGQCQLSGDQPESEDIYSDYAFLTKTIRNLSVKDVLTALEGEGLSLTDMFPVLRKDKALNTNWEEELIPSHASRSEYPEREFSQQLMSRSEFSDSALIGFKKEFYPSSQEFIRQFLRMDNFHGSSDSRKGNLMIRTTDRRARIVIDADHVAFESKSSDVCLVGQLNTDEKLLITDDREHMIISLDSPELELWLLNEQEEILDYRSSSIYRYKFGHISENDARAIKAIIDRGEGNETEFKEYIDLTASRGSKADDIKKTVCAFSNARGGHLIIGVADDGLITGIDEKVRADYKSDIDSAIRAYIDDISKHLIEALSETQCFEVASLKIGEGHVVIVTVARTDKPNYYVNSGQGYIRKGATSARMYSSDMREQDRR